MKTNISKQLGLPVSAPEKRAASIESQLGFVAEYDKSLNTKNDAGYFNASGEDIVRRKYYTGKKSDVDMVLTAQKINTSEDLAYLESKKNFFKTQGKDVLEANLSKYPVNYAQAQTNSQQARNRGSILADLWKVDAVIAAIDKRIEEVKIILEKKAAKAKADAEAAEAKAKAEAAAAAEAARLAKIKDLQKQISETNDPNVKKQLTEQLTGLLKEGAATVGGNKIVIFGAVIAVVGLVYYFFKNRD